MYICFCTKKNNCMHFETKGIVYRLTAKQKLPMSLDEAWAFLSSPKNLKTITPDYMGFEILSKGTRSI